MATRATNEDAALQSSKIWLEDFISIHETLYPVKAQSQPQSTMHEVREAQQNKANPYQRSCS